MSFKKLKELVASVPMLFVFATASRTYPDVVAEDMLEEINSSNNPNVIAVEKYDLMSLHKSGVKRSVGYDSDRLKSLSGNYTCICPFHNDTSEGSLVVTTSHNGGKNIWKCFACGEGFDTIDFEMKYFNLKFKDAVYHLAYRLGFVDKQSMLSKSANSFNAKAVSKKVITKKQVDMVIADEDVINNVYQAMQKLYPLTESHKKHLLNKRGLTKDDFVNYFSFPQRKVNVPKEVFDYILKAFCEKYYEKPFKELTEEEVKSAMNAKGILKLKEQMKNVPGFYLNTNTGKLEWVYKAGMGLLATDDLGIIRGVQVQNMDANNNGPKYVWWSSQIKLGEPGCEGGSSAGSPGGVVFPKDPYRLRQDNNNVAVAPIVITEGKYKAEALARQGHIAIYVSGVSTWRSIIPNVERLRGDRSNIYVAFDADSFGNTAVHSQLKEMCLELKKMGLEPFLYTWSKQKGKGFDDLLLAEGFNNFRYFVKVVKFDSFENIFDNEVAQLLQKAGVERVNQLPKELKASFTVALQRRMEQALDLPLFIKK